MALKMRKVTQIEFLFDYHVFFDYFAFFLSCKCGFDFLFCLHFVVKLLYLTIGVLVFKSIKFENL